MMSLETEVKRYTTTLLEFMQQEEVLKIKLKSVELAKTESRLRGLNLDYNNSENWDEKTLNYFRNLAIKYYLDEVKKVYSKMIQFASETGLKPVFYSYKSLNEKEMIEIVQEKIKKEGDI